MDETVAGASSAAAVVAEAVTRASKFAAYVRQPAFAIQKIKERQKLLNEIEPGLTVENLMKAADGGRRGRSRARL